MWQLLVKAECARGGHWLSTPECWLSSLQMKLYYPHLTARVLCSRETSPSSRSDPFVPTMVCTLLLCLSRFTIIKLIAFFLLTHFSRSKIIYAPSLGRRTLSRSQFHAILAEFSDAPTSFASVFINCFPFFLLSVVFTIHVLFAT